MPYYALLAVCESRLISRECCLSTVHEYQLLGQPYQLSRQVRGKQFCFNMASYTKLCLFVLFLHCSFVAVLSDSLTDLIREHIQETDKSCGNGMKCVQPELCDENRHKNVIINYRSKSKRIVDCEADEKCCFVKEKVYYYIRK